ncbi:MAG: glycosyltransferase family 2 protein [Planctomycetota bacterium]
MSTAAPQASRKSDAMRSPRVIVVLVHYDHLEQTLACIRSLGDLRGDHEIVVVDNGGDEAAREILIRSGVSLLVSPHNGGYTGGNNLGIRHALERGAEYVLLLNPDTVLLNADFVIELTRYLEQHPTVGAVGPRVHLREPGRVQNTVLRFPWFWRRVTDWVRYRTWGIAIRSGDRPWDAEALNGVCVLFRTSCLRDVGPLDERMFAYIEDIEWSYRAEAGGWQRVYLPIDGVVHLQKQSGYERGGKVDFLLKRNTLYFLLKHRKYVQAASYTLATLLLANLHRLASLASRRTESVPPFPFMRQLMLCFGLLWLGQWEAAMRFFPGTSRGGMA